VGAGNGRSGQKRGGNGGLLGNTTSSSGRRIEGAVAGDGMGISGIAAYGSESLLDEESQGILSSSRKLLAER
jgi:hypothetical protein